MMSALFPTFRTGNGLFVSVGLFIGHFLPKTDWFFSLVQRS